MQHLSLSKAERLYRKADVFAGRKVYKQQFQIQKFLAPKAQICLLFEHISRN